MDATARNGVGCGRTWSVHRQHDALTRPMSGTSCPISFGLDGDRGASEAPELEQIVRQAYQPPFAVDLLPNYEQKRRNPRAPLICPNTGSTITFRNAYNARPTGVRNFAAMRSFAFGLPHRHSPPPSPDAAAAPSPCTGPTPSAPPLCGGLSSNNRCRQVAGIFFAAPASSLGRSIPACSRLAIVTSPAAPLVPCRCWAVTHRPQ